MINSEISKNSEKTMEQHFDQIDNSRIYIRDGKLDLDGILGFHMTSHGGQE